MSDVKNVIIVLDGGSADIRFQDDDVNVLIINKKSSDLFLYQDKFICKIIDTNDDGSVDIKCIETLDGLRHNRFISSVNPSHLEFYSSDEDDDDDFLFEE